MYYEGGYVLYNPLYMWVIKKTFEICNAFNCNEIETSEKNKI